MANLNFCWIFWVDLACVLVPVCFDPNQNHWEMGGSFVTFLPALVVVRFGCCQSRCLYTNLDVSVRSCKKQPHCQWPQDHVKPVKRWELGPFAHVRNPRPWEAWATTQNTIFTIQNACSWESWISHRAGASPCIELLSHSKKLQHYCEYFPILLSQLLHLLQRFSCFIWYCTNILGAAALKGAIGSIHMEEAVSPRAALCDLLCSALLSSLGGTRMLLMLHCLFPAKLGRDGKDWPVPLSSACAFSLGSRGYPWKREELESSSPSRVLPCN